MKYIHVHRTVSKQASLPSRGAWIEILSYTVKGETNLIGSLPSRGAWIEIALGAADISGTTQSLPSRGAWIEIVGDAFPREGLEVSLPSRGAWIEIAQENTVVGEE